MSGRNVGSLIRMHTRAVVLLLATSAAAVVLPCSVAADEPVLNDPSIGTAIATLRKDLPKTGGLNAVQLAELDEWLGKAEKAGGQACEVASALQGFAGEIGVLGNPGEAVSALGRQGARLRGKVLAALSEKEGCAGPISVYVDPEQDRREVLPGFEQPRPLAGLVDDEGTRSRFVADELIVSTWDKSMVGAVVDRWGGKILHQLDSIGPGNPPQYLVRIDTGLVDPATLSKDLGELNGAQQKAISLAVSSEGGLRLLAAAASAARDKFDVSVNWVAERQDFEDQSTAEAGFGPPGFQTNSANGYSRDAYQWSYLDDNGAQAIGVAQAWTLLESVGRLDNKVRIGITDGGFRPQANGDLPGQPDVLSAFPLVGPYDPDFLGSDPWHGTHVASAAAAVPGNYIGAAGPAGPIAELTLVFSGGDYFFLMAGMGTAKVKGNRIISVSSGVSVPWPLAWTVLLFDGFTAYLRSLDVLTFAPAMNSGKNVDAETCFIECWEKAWITPCENAGVRCVGGLAPNSRGRDPNSNHGHEDVDIFAPFSLLSGADPAHPDQSTVRAIHGTSFSTPFTAGVAALIWAAEPNLNIDQVEDALLRNRQPSPDAKVGNRVINALSAVRDVLTPLVRITNPGDGQDISTVVPTEFRAAAFDDGLGPPGLTWTLDGTLNLGSGPSVLAMPPPGIHLIRVTATFPGGATATDVVQVRSVNFSPAMQLTGPKRPSGNVPTYGVSELIPFHAISLDDAGPLAESQVRWFLNGSPTSFASGHNPIANTGATSGLHTITVRGCDIFGVCGSDSITISIVPDSMNQPPTVKINNPANGALLWVNFNENGHFFHVISLSGTAADPEGGPVTLTWLDNGVEIGTGADITVRLAGVCGDYTHALTLRAVDAAGNTRHDVVTVRVSMLC